MHHPRPLHTALLLSFLACAPVTGGASAQASPRPIDPLSVPRPTVVALEIDEPIELDGLLDEAAWGRAVPTSGTWIQITPEPGMPATERTSVRLLFDAERLYIGAVMYDSEIGRISVPGLEQDFDTPSSDMFGFGLDTYHDRQNGFVFAINPAGAVFDGQAFDDQRTMNTAWEGITEIATSQNDSSWVVEMAIPFATLRFNPVEGEQVWGINFTRRLRRRNEDSMWAPVPLQFRVYKFSMAGTLEGLTGLPRGRNLWAKPYVLGSRVTGATRPDAVEDAEVGLDVKWGVTPRLTLDLTANTDFSQVEVDAEQVNLSRFSLFFPEKRDFFLENEGTFAFQDVAPRNFRTGSSDRNFRLFHSRRIGLSDTREPLPIGGGARLTGRLGPAFEVGFLDMQTRSVSPAAGVTGYDAENFAVARVRRLLPGGSAVGAMLVNRQETAGAGRDWNRSYGVDGNFNVRSDMIVSAYAARTDLRAPAGDDANALMAQVAYREAIWNLSGLFKHVGDGFDPGVGFVDRRGIRRYFATVGAHPKIRRAGVLEVNPYVDLDFYTSLDGTLETRTIEPGLNLPLMDGGSVAASYSDRYERITTPTSIAGVTIPVGVYEWREPMLRYTAPGSRTLSGSIRASWGEFYDGERTSVAGTARIRPNEHVSLDLGAQHNDLRIAGSSFTADLYSARLRYAYDTRTFFMGFVQYNETTEELIANVRFNLIHAPLSDIFLVLTERRTLADGSADSVLERGVTLKVTKLFAS